MSDGFRGGCLPDMGKLITPKNCRRLRHEPHRVAVADCVQGVSGKCRVRNYTSQWLAVSNQQPRSSSQDHTGQQWLTAFEEAGVKIMGKSAHELKELEGHEEFERLVQVHLLSS